MIAYQQLTTPEHGLVDFLLFLLYSMECLLPTSSSSKLGYHVATMQILIQDASSDNLLISGLSRDSWCLCRDQVCY